MRAVRSKLISSGAGRLATRCAVVAIAGVAAGCSTDVSRFDFPILGMTDPGPNAPVAAAKPRGYAGATGSTAQPESMRAGAADRDTATVEPLVRPQSSVRVSNLPEPVRPEPGAGAFGRGAVASAPPIDPPAKGGDVGRPPEKAPVAARSTPAPATAAATGTGKTIEVAQGDTLYKISRQHGVPISALMSANGLQNPNIKPGQKLVVPANTAVAHNRVPTRAEAQQQRVAALSQSTTAAGQPVVKAAPVVAAPAVTSPAAAPQTPPVDGYTVQAGDSIYAIARKFGVKAEDIAQTNGIADVAKIRQGQVLKIPAAGSVASAPSTAQGPSKAAPVAAKPTQPVKSAAVTPPAAPAQPVEQGSSEPSPAPKEASEPVRPQPVAAAPAAATGFRWPVKGKVITKFGPKEDGSHSDGINIAVPAGSEVHAAEGGTVAYAGNELKGYGNLILVRHADNWVSAYAHNETLLVKRGDQVKRGQPIAKAGKSGNVEQPQVHFELRQGSKPVDPLKHLGPQG